MSQKHLYMYLSSIVCFLYPQLLVLVSASNSALHMEQISYAVLVLQLLSLILERWTFVLLCFFFFHNLIVLSVEMYDLKLNFCCIYFVLLLSSLLAMSSHICHQFIELSPISELKLDNCCLCICSIVNSLTFKWSTEVVSLDPCCNTIMYKIQ